MLDLGHGLVTHRTEVNNLFKLSNLINRFFIRILHQGLQSLFFIFSFPSSNHKAGQMHIQYSQWLHFSDGQGPEGRLGFQGRCVLDPFYLYVEMETFKVHFQLHLLGFSPIVRDQRVGLAESPSRPIVIDHPRKFSRYISISIAIFISWAFLRL